MNNFQFKNVRRSARLRGCVDRLGSIYNVSVQVKVKVFNVVTNKMVYNLPNIPVLLPNCVYCNVRVSSRLNNNPLTTKRDKIFNPITKRLVYKTQSRIISVSLYYKLYRKLPLEIVDYIYTMT